MADTESVEMSVRQHPLWLSIVLSLFPGLALGLFIVLVVPLLQESGIDSAFALFGGIGLIIVPIELAVLSVTARRTTGSWSPLAVVDFRERIPAKKLLPLAAGLAAWFIVMLVAWSALAEGWIVSRMDSWVPESILQFAQVDAGGAPSTTAMAVLLVIAFVFNGLIGPVTEEMYFRGFLLPRMQGLGKWAPVVGTVLFAVYHVWTPWRWLQILVGFLPLTVAVWKTRSIYVSMTAHVAINVVFLLMLASAFVG